MSRSSTTRTPPRNQPRHKPKQPTHQENSAKSDGQKWLSNAARGWIILGRFGWGFLGIAFIILALITLLGFFNITQGTLLNIWLNTLSAWFGWGKFIIPLTFLFISIAILRRRSDHQHIIRLDRILVLEAVIFCLLSIFSIMGGMSLERAENGLDGGIIGWGLSNLLSSFLPMPWSTLLLVLLAAFGLVWGSGVLGKLLKFIEQWLFPAGMNSDMHGLSTQTSSDLRQPDVQQQVSRDHEMLTSQTGTTQLPRDNRLPPLNLLSQEQNSHPDESQIHDTALQIEKTLDEFGIPARVVGFRVGPTVTQYAVEPGFVERIGLDGQPVQQKVRVSQISALARDLALALSAERLRIEAPVPGQSFVGIEVPNSHGSTVKMRPLLESESFLKTKSSLSIVLGRDVSGTPVVADLSRMPHLLIAGTTGSGKTICITALTTCLMMNNTPDNLKMVMLDPKKVELMRFTGLPHLLGNVETELERMLAVLRWALVEMDHRYRLLEASRARDLSAFNAIQRKRKSALLPRIVILIDELADLMMSAPDQTEHSLIRLAQMARATGIHLVVATQRPSTDVITGLIKANFPARISFTVATSVDSRVILDVNGAETLLGRGDMLFLNPEIGNPIRAQGALVTDHEIERVINFWRKMAPATELKTPWEELVEVEDNSDDLVKKAIELVKKSRHASASLLQRRLRIGYPRAARLLDELQTLGVVGPPQGGGREREVLISPDEGDEVPDVDEEDN